MRIIVCGGREYSDQGRVDKVLFGVHARNNVTCVISGGADGADACGEAWARQNEIKIEIFPAKWKIHKRSAGPIRNKQMIIEGNPDGVVAFPGNAGTADMIKQAKKAGLKVYQVE